jgi:inner membrane protein
MLRNTHIAAGISASILVTWPDTIKDLIFAVGFGMVGAQICDIDLDKSKFKGELNQIIFSTFMIFVLTTAADFYLGNGLLVDLVHSGEYTSQIAGVLLFIGTCLFGQTQPHRKFMHSFLALALTGCSLYMIYPKIVPYYVTGFLSHILLDLLNKTKIYLFCPAKKGYCLGLCKSNGTANAFILVAGIFASAYLILRCLVQILFPGVWTGLLPLP